MNKHFNLCDIKPGDKAKIFCINSKGTIRRRLLDMGLTENTVIECVGKSPLGDPIAFLVRGAIVALRSEDCKNILIYPIGR